MSEKVGGYPYYNYENAVRNAALLLLELNADLLTPEQREKLGISGPEFLDDNALKDRISRLIDSKEFNNACKIESEFAYQQSEELLKKAKELLTGNGEDSRDLTRIIDEETKHADDRKRSLDNHEKYNFKKKRKSKGYSLDDE